MGNHDAVAPQSPDAPEKKKRGLIGRFRQWMHDNHGKLFWIHSVYALALGAFVAAFAAKGIDYARYLVLFLIGAWVVIFLIFRFFGAGKEQSLDTTGRKLKFFAMTYVLKNLYQGMLFFLLPFYWKTAVTDGPTLGFLVLLAVCAFLSTMDVIFDKVLMRWRILSSAFYSIVLFAALNVAVSVLMPNTRAIVSTAIAAGVTVVAFWSMHVPWRVTKRPLAALLLVSLTSAAVAAAWFGRRYIPPVPAYITAGAVGPEVLPDGRLALKVTELHTSKLADMTAVTDVVFPGGDRTSLEHVWVHEGVPLEVTDLVTERQSDLIEDHGKKRRLVRLRSRLPVEKLPNIPTGDWSVDVWTADGQLIGRTRFRVVE